MGAALRAVRWIALVSVAASSIACFSPAGRPGAPALDTEYHLAPPDTLRITVRPEPVIERELVVRPDGRVSVDLIGDVDVRGRTVSDVRLEIASRLKEFIVQPDVTVQLVRSESRTFYILGEVNRPGAYPLIGDVTALYALGMAGGPTRFASQDSARLVRPSSEGELVYAVHFESMTQYGYGATNYILQPGDVVYVPPNLSARIGYALGTLFFPLQQILGLGGTVINAAVMPGA